MTSLLFSLTAEEAANSKPYFSFSFNLNLHSLEILDNLKSNQLELQVLNLGGQTVVRLNFTTLQ